MSDERLRELERRWKETGSAHDESVLINERMRVGRATPARLWSAGLLGSAAARMILGQHATWGDDLAWVNALDEQPVAVRATLLILDDFCGAGRLPPVVEQMKLLVRRWLADPYAVSKDDIKVLGLECSAQATLILRTPYADVYGEWYETGDALLSQLAAILSRLIHDGSQAGTADLLSFLEEIRDSVSAVSDEHIREVLRRGLVPWLLGHYDPLNIEKAGPS